MPLMNLDRTLRQCAYPACPHQRRAWRVWLEPVRGYSLEGAWYCAAECFERALVAAIGKFFPETPQPPARAHRVPLGLLMLSRGLVDNDQLKRALKAQKDAGSGRVGEWLRHIGAVSEEQVTQVLGAQWSIPVFPLSQSRRFLECAHLVPYRLLELVEMVPVHHIPTSRHLYMAFTDRVNYSALYAVEKMLECRTEPCLAVQSHVLQAMKELRDMPRPVEIFVEGASDPGEMSSTITNQVVKLEATNVRVSAFEGFVWGRILSPSGYTDMLFQAQKNPPEFIVAAESQE